MRGKAERVMCSVAVRCQRGQEEKLDGRGKGKGMDDTEER